MKLKPKPVFDLLLRMRAYFQDSGSIGGSDTANPFRAELYNADQMESHAKVVAASHNVVVGKATNKLLKRLDENQKVLLEARNLLVDSIRSGQTITPGGEWLLDNFYLIEEQIVISRKHLPKGYSEGLPYLRDGITNGMPRVYDIVLEIISHSDGRVDAKSLKGFITAYQSSKLLTLGELWAIPIMLRIAVIENLRRVSEQIALDMIDDNLADYWADKMLETAKEDPSDLILTVAEMVQAKPVLNSPFVAGFTRRLSGKGPILALPLSWMEQQLLKTGTAGNDLVWQENQKQAANQASVRNSIGTLRLIGATDWREFVEALSSVEKVLRQDPAGIYPNMDFATRDRYRHVVEAIAKDSLLSETEVAEKVIAITREAHTKNAPRQGHIGFYLIDKGKRTIEQAAKIRYTVRQHLLRGMQGKMVFLYLFYIFILAAAGAAGMLSVAYCYGNFSWLVLALTGALSFGGSLQLAVSFINWLATVWVRPALLPRMDFSKGIPAECKTMVAIPTMLTGREDIDALTEALEVRFLANKDENLYFALLTDFTDADQEIMPADDSLLEDAISRIAELNSKYAPTLHPDRFFLFHRSRKWNAKEGKWMGYERKRGKLSALNALLRKSDGEAFTHITGNYQAAGFIKYIITLDSDTQLPREAGWKFVATMAHPLNHAVYNEQKKRVTEGYGILQPRVASNFTKGPVSLYLRMQGDLEGIDPYTRASSDVYQDLFNEGSFIGKGIYDIDVFEHAVGQLFEENRILSHDLLEGCYTRSGLVSDVLLYEQNPSGYEADVKRNHRWIRGDWQIAAWIMPYVTGSNGRFSVNTLSLLSKWKIFDNLRRSLMPLSLLIILLLGWSVMPYPWFWTIAVTMIVLLPVMAAAILRLILRPDDLDLKAHVLDVGTSIKHTLLRFMFGLAVLPYESYRYTDAIVRANWRMIISHKHLLQWTTSAISSDIKNTLWSNYLKMLIGPLLSVACICLFLVTNYPAFFVALPILILWLLSPAIAWKLSIPEKQEIPELSKGQTLFLHQSARKTWLFFQKFVTEQENWLPPDNFQQHPEPVIAHRTSPTNIGLTLLANLTAYDFGYIPMGTLLQHTEDTMATLFKMDRYKGHFYNWYDTQTLQTLLPRYVSTVDSGNLLGHLLTLRQGLLLLKQQPLFAAKTLEGLQTTLSLLKDSQPVSQNEALQEIGNLINIAMADESNSLSGIKNYLELLLALSEKLVGSAPEINDYTTNWVDEFKTQLQDIRNDFYQQAPWAAYLPVPAPFTKLNVLDINLSTLNILEIEDKVLQQLGLYKGQANSTEENEWLENIGISFATATRLAAERSSTLEKLAAQCEQLSTVEYDFLYDTTTCLLRIGFNVDEQRKDDSYYDMLASESRLGIFVGIAQGKLPQESWFSLGRLLTNSKGGPILLSWSGSMFEYLMPQLVMPTYENTLLYQTNIANVKLQIEYGKKRGIPWGISESGYNNVDANLNYQYHAFGVPGIGLKRGLEEDLVIAPYASMLALMVLPSKACANLQLLSDKGFEGEYGFFEAIDYTPARLPRGQDHVVINSYMVHHQGMGFLSLAYVLLNKPMQQRFVAELRFQATLLLLQERIPKTSIFYAHTADSTEIITANPDSQVRHITTADTPTPQLHLLSNGHYQVMVSNSGGGYSRWNDLSVTRWREDGTKDDYGLFCYIKDVASGNFWSNAHHPTMKMANSYEAIFSQGHIEFHRQDDGFDTKTDIVVSPEDNVEIRRVKITNRTSVSKTIEVTSYSETVIASQASDEAHPAFSNLFVQTEILQEYNAIFSTRRPKSEHETPPHLFHLMDVHRGTVEAVSYETDRMQFIGRGKTLAYPHAIDEPELSGRQGAVLDPINAIRYRITLRPGQVATIDLILGISETRDSCEALMHKYRDRNIRRRALELSWTHSQVLIRQINTTEADAQLFEKLAAFVIYANPNLRAATATIKSNLRGQSGLWSHSVSGDLPIVLLQVLSPDSIDLVIQMIKAHTFWQLKGLAVDLVIWNEDHGTYRQVLQDQILGMITAGNNLTHNVPGNIYVKSTDQISPEDRILFESVARVIIRDDKGSLADQINNSGLQKGYPALLQTIKDAFPAKNNAQPLHLPDDLQFYNGTGGFSADGKEYKICTNLLTKTPAPWVNVIANPYFGTIASENGSAYTWAINAHEYRITPWSDDPVSDGGGEAFYIRDEESGFFWSPAPYPAQGDTPYITTHGFGYTTYEHCNDAVHTEMKVYVDKEWPIKFVVIKIKNQSGRAHKLSATGFLEIILGDVRSKTNMNIVSEQDAKSGALLFRNRYNQAFSERVAFFKVNGGGNFSYTADRKEFIGRNRSLANPAAMKRSRLSGSMGAAIDACGALQVKFDLADGEEKEIVFQIGSESTTAAAMNLIQKFDNRDAVIQSLAEVREYWRETLSAVQVTTPDNALNVLANGWLTYQTMASRLFARSGFYQSGGAFGFRDQLQDVLSILHSKPQMAREQILLNASRQFIEGDVQHWWHPPEGRGVRTTCSDDLLWLPFAVGKYIATTGDSAILWEAEPFLESRVLKDGEESLYDLSPVSSLTADLYHHSVLAIQHSLKFGVHGLPFMGGGDWNDGMDRVGNKGTGESVWLAFFLYDVLTGFQEVALAYGDTAFAATCSEQAVALQQHIEANAWDGEWYKRAWFDDGTPLGSKENEECSIDAISQSWAVLSGAATHERGIIAMASVDKNLVSRDMKLIKLLTPAFDKSALNPGYIKGYVPGVRENGGQYSHAAIWTLMAFAALQEREKVYELFSMIQPVNHSLDVAAAKIYKVEPYVMAADVYANESHKGRGGWTWYTGSAGWMYQFITGSLLGIQLQHDRLHFIPCFPLEWASVIIDYRYKNTTYNITVYQVTGVTKSWWIMDGNMGDGNMLPLTDDGLPHKAMVFVTYAKKLAS